MGRQLLGVERLSEQEARGWHGNVRPSVQAEEPGKQWRRCSDYGSGTYRAFHRRVGLLRLLRGDSQRLIYIYIYIYIVVVVDVIVAVDYHVFV